MSDIVYKNFHFSTPFLRGYKKLKIPIVDASGNPAWPQVFPESKISEIKETVGPRHFSAQMMLEYVASDKIRLDPGEVRLYTDEFDGHKCAIGENLVTGVTVYWDPSIGHKNSDGSVCVLLYRDDKNRKLFLHDILYLVVPDDVVQPLTYQCNKVLDFLMRYNLYRINIEVNGLGNALPEIMHDISIKRGTNVFVQKITNHANKESRILDAIEASLASGNLFAHTRITQTPFFSEMLGWTVDGAEHDDGLDAVAGAIMSMPMPVRPLGARLKPFTANTNFKI